MSKIFEPFEAKGLKFKNRIIHVPTTLNMSDPHGYATRKIAAAYGSIARGGVAATVVGATCVRRDGLINELMLGLYDEDYVIGFRDTVAEIKNNGSLAGIQLFYGGLISGLGATTELEPGKGWIPNTVAWGPSNKYTIGNPESGVVPTEVYESLVEDHAQAARRAKEAGFDFVSFHFCHGSLPHTTLSHLSNQGRTDKYADHFLFCEEILQRTQEVCGKDFPIIPRLCVDENLEGGYDIEYFAEHYAPRLHKLGIAVLDCTFGSMLAAKSRRDDIKSSEFIGPSFYTPKLVNKGNIEKLREELVKRGIDMPLIGSGNLLNPDNLRTMVDDAGADFAGSCRLNLDDPDFPNKMLYGKEDEIRLSTHTGASLLQGNIFSKGVAGSAQNPVFGNEDQYRLIPTNRPKKIVVIGGGSGGMEYAITAKEIGHDVVLFEKSDTLGGAMDWAGNYPNLPNMTMLRNQPNYHRKMMEKWKVETRLGVEATAEDILAEKPDVIVVATGASQVIPDAEGMDVALKERFALTMDQAMSRHESVNLGKSVIVWGAGAGAELAVELKLSGHEVRLLDKGATGSVSRGTDDLVEIGGDTGAFTAANYIGSRIHAIHALLAKADVHPEIGFDLASIKPGVATFTKPDGSKESVKADSIIICQGLAPINSLEQELRTCGVPVHVVGDAREPRSYANAIHEAAYLVRNL